MKKPTCLDGYLAAEIKIEKLTDDAIKNAPKTFRYVDMNLPATTEKRGSLVVGSPLNYETQTTI